MTTATSFTNVRWGTDLCDVFDVALHPTRDDGAGNPMLVYRHTGGGDTGSKTECWDGGFQELDAMWAYLLSPSRAVHFDIFSVESAQRTFGSVLPRTSRAQFPQTVVSFQRAVRNTGMIAKDIYGSDPTRKACMGGSHGAWLSTMSMLMQPDFGGSGVRIERRKRFETHGYNSRPFAIVPWQLAYPDFRKIASPTGITFTGATISGTAVTGTALAFEHYRFTAGDVLVITGGTATPGTYTVSAKNSDNVHLTLATSAGSGTADGYLSTDQTDLQWSKMLFGTLPENAVGGDGLPQYLEWDLLPRSLRETVSAQFWAEQNQLAYAVPSFFISFNDLLNPSTGIHPYGSNWGGLDIHDWHGARDLSAMLSSKGKSSTFQDYNGLTEWNDGTRPAQIYNWLVAQLAEL
jgi:hypothetical protein